MRASAQAAEQLVWSPPNPHPTSAISKAWTMSGGELMLGYVERRLMDLFAGRLVAVILTGMHSAG
ncbi:hypothetical protein GCM10009789_39190 [Kribbella sancticallisti]|uniref:Uncharacterized protein n=1 Tax=Kribbella sancticallisti TaxID=460087 RepID=A0ABN2DNF0_9ACTN